MIRNLNISWFPLWGWYVGRDCDCYGDVVVWLGRLWISWNWGRDD